MLKRSTLLLALTAALVLALPWSTLQLPSAFGSAEAALQCRPPQPSWLRAGPPPAVAADGPLLRVVSYNLHSGLGPDWRLSAGRTEVAANLRAIAAHIAAAAPADEPVDAVGLNEVDFGSRRSGWLDQARFLADELERLTGYPYRVVRGETWRRDWPRLEVRFGNALLTRHPLAAQRSCPLGAPCAGEREAPLPPVGGLLTRFLGEPRGVVQARIRFHGRPLDLLVTHLEAFVPAQREAQAAELLERFVDPDTATVVLGDVNTVPTAMTAHRRHFAADRAHDILTGGPLIDARVSLAAARAAADLTGWATYPAARPLWPLDGAFASAELAPTEARVIGTTESDHRGLAVTFRRQPAGVAAARAAWHQRVRGAQVERILACDFAVAPAADDPRSDWLQRVLGLATDTAPPTTL